ncbi:MurR/RpiR family transcriptional regulator [Microbacterium foliorum]|uniref:MurR/RpiR family transcriptional regulator n=1 Tax=Microbacterium foliorum TaxID=104336 RepID=UPI0009C24F8C|nr:MurR/RpiR family transcriptional regulator [Microbacterium foliorum]AQY01847.1 hypothetical protein B2G67_10515 [Microbacterium foliorum]
MPTLDQRFEAHRDLMTPAITKVAQYLLDQPRRALVATASELAREANVSDATVIRAVQVLGYSGLPEMRREVSEQLTARYDPRDELEHRVSDGVGMSRSAFEAVVTDAIDLLNETRTTLDEHAFNDAVRLLSNASHIVVAGWGTGAAAAEFATLTLNRVGYRATAAMNSGFRLADDLAHLIDTDVVVILAPLLHVHEIDVTLDRAAQGGIPTILITEILGEKLKKRVTRVLNVAPSLRLNVSGMIGIIAVLDALILALASLNPDRARATWERINALRGEFKTRSIADSPLLNRS